MTQATQDSGRTIRSHDAFRGAVVRSIVIGLTAFLTVVDLFATQAILPSLTRHYGVTPAAMGFAVNASTLGMAVSGLAVGYFSRASTAGSASSSASSCLPSRPRCSRGAGPHDVHDPARRAGAVHGRGLHADARLSRRAVQRRGCRWRFAAYITGNVASNLIGRLISAAVADHLRPRRQFLFLRRCSICPARCWSISPSKARRR